MGMVGTAAGAGVSVVGGMMAANAMSGVRSSLERELAANQAWYDRRYNEDATQRADAQRLLTLTEESIKKRNRQAAGTAAVMGGTDESVALEKEANSRVLADATSQIAAQADARKAQIENQYMQTKSNLNAQMRDLDVQKAQAIAQATQGAASAASALPW